MNRSKTRRRLFRSTLVGLALTAVVGLTGCQMSINGQTLPSGYYMTDDVQYYAPGPEFKLSREAAALRAARAEQALQQSRR